MKPDICPKLGFVDIYLTSYDALHLRHQSPGGEVLIMTKRLQRF